MLLLEQRYQNSLENQGGCLASAVEGISAITISLSYTLCVQKREVSESIINSAETQSTWVRFPIADIDFVQINLNAAQWIHAVL